MKQNGKDNNELNEKDKNELLKIFQKKKYLRRK